jgi:hypothetical protein
MHPNPAQGVHASVQSGGAQVDAELASKLLASGVTKCIETFGPQGNNKGGVMDNAYHPTSQVVLTAWSTE